MDSREVMMEVIRLSNKDNFLSVQLTLACGAVMLHQHEVRKANGGQFLPVKNIYSVHTPFGSAPLVKFNLHVCNICTYFIKAKTVSSKHV